MVFRTKSNACLFSLQTPASSLLSWNDGDPPKIPLSIPAWPLDRHSTTVPSKAEDDLAAISTISTVEGLGALQSPPHLICWRISVQHKNLSEPL